jgi:hypothetical protein
MSWFVVIALCGQLEGAKTPYCSPYTTSKQIEYTSYKACSLVADSERLTLENGFKARAAEQGRKIEKLMAFSECLSAKEAIKLLESNNPS